MRRIGISLMAALTVLLPLGCDTKSSSGKTADAKVANAKEKLSEAEKATAEAAKAKRDEYALAMQKKLDALDVQYKALDKRAGEATADAKKDLEARAKIARAKRDAAGKKLDELKEAGVDRWEKVKDGVENAFEDLKKSFE